MDVAYIYPSLADGLVLAHQESFGGESKHTSRRSSHRTGSPSISPFYKHSVEPREMPLIFHVSIDPFIWNPNAHDSDDDEGPLLELAGPVTILILSTLAAVGTKSAHQAQRDIAKKAAHLARHTAGFDRGSGNTCFPTSHGDGEATY
jgi:hypothetical protein